MARRRGGKAGDRASLIGVRARHDAHGPLRAIDFWPGSLAVADRFYCLLEGRVTLAGIPADTSRDAVMKHYFGE